MNLRRWLIIRSFEYPLTSKPGCSIIKARLDAPKVLAETRSAYNERSVNNLIRGLALCPPPCHHSLSCQQQTPALELASHPTKVNDRETAIESFPRQLARLDRDICRRGAARATTSTRAAAPFVWIEGENPAFINVKPDINASGRPQLLSGAKWLTVHADPGEVGKTIPAEGVRIRYEFKVEKPATHSIWGRIGYEFARSPFDWRIDDGAWSTIKPDDVTTDLTELSFFTETGWRQFGSRSLTTGNHTLEIRIARQKNSKGEFERLLFGLDALCLTPDPFLANGKFQPGQEWRDDRDKKAEKVVFQLPEKPADDAQIGVALAGLWEVCRHDEDLPGKVAEPISSLPEHPFWRAIEVPGDKNSLRDDLVFAHRIWYRTRVDVPKSQARRSFFLVFPQNNLNTTVYVNGVLCGFEKHPFVHFQIDVTKGIKPGVNEIWVGIRDAWYGYSASPTDPMKLRRHFNTPLQFTHSGFQDLAYPVWNSFQSGILATPTFESAGRVYVSDVFCKPSVAKKSLELEVTVANPSGGAASGDIVCEAVNAKSGAVEKKFAAVPFPFQLGGMTTAVLHITEPWENPKLWWPDDPNMYRLRTTVRFGKASEDVAETPFGFREWAIDGKNFTLNGYAWHGWNIGIPGSTKEKWLENYRKLHQTQTRICGASQGGLRPLFDMTPDDALDWCDREGVVVRRCGPLDGEAIGYFAVENDPELKKLYGSEIKMELLNEVREQMVAQVRGERNHPSVQIWSIENEWLYINCINLYGGLMDQFEAESHKVAEALKIVDPTRPCMTDGGGANKAQDMPVHGNHYVADSDLTRYPALAYEANDAGGGRGRWTWDEKRPRYIGEDFFYTGNHPELSTIGGEAAFGGKMSTLSACGLMLQILQQGYRWADFGAWDFYCGDGDADNSQWAYMAPRVVLCREWDWTFASGRKVSRTLAVFNDTHDADPITVGMRLEVAGKKVSDENRQFAVTPGGRKEFKLDLKMPVVDARQEGRLVFVAFGSRQGCLVRHESCFDPARCGRWRSARLDHRRCAVRLRSGGRRGCVSQGSCRSIHGREKSRVVAEIGEGAGRRQGCDRCDREHVEPIGGVCVGRPRGDRAGANESVEVSGGAGGNRSRPRTSAASLLPRISTIRYFVVSPKRISSLGAPMRFSSAMPT